MLKDEINNKVLVKQPTIFLVLIYETREITVIVKMMQHQDNLQLLLK